MKPLRVLSLFSGVGGFDMGLENAGMETVFQCEVDKSCQEVLKHWWPQVPKWDDVSTLTGEYILSQVDGIDVVAWGSPCQDLSLAGRRKGLSGERSGLFHQGIRIIKELRELSNGKYPTWSIWENVVGALSSNGGADFGQVLHEMDEAGACFSEWAILDAQYFGVPQRRRRVFVTSCFDSSISELCSNPLLPVAQSGSGHPAPSPESWEGYSNEAPAGFGNSGFNKWKRAELAITLSARDFKSPNTIVVDEQNLLIDGRRSNDVRIYTEPVQTLEARMGTGGNNVPVISQEPIAFSHTQGLDIQPSEEAWPTLRANGSGHAVAYPIQGTIIGRSDTAGPAGPGIAEDGNPMYTLDTVSQHGVAHDEPIVFAPGGMVRLGGNVWDGGPVPTLRAEAKRGDNEPHIVQEGYTATSFAKYVEGVGTLRAEGGDLGGGSETIVAIEPAHSELVVRRLTPLECNRLQGWPDGHTAVGINGPISDTQQYKMCGNGVASPVAEWIGKHIVETTSLTSAS